MIKNNKFIIIFILFILFICLSLNNVYATNSSTDNIEVKYKDKTITFPTLLENQNCNFTEYYYTLSYCSDNRYWLNFCKEEDINKVIYMPYKSWGTDMHKILFNNKKGDNLTEFRYYLDNNKWVMRDSGTDGLVRNTLVDFILSTNDIYNEDGTIFFQKTPLLEQQVVEIMEITQVEEIPKAIAEVMKMIIPIGLVVLSAVLIIYLVHLVISRAI